MENYELFKNDLRYLFSMRLPGYKLFSRGQYPFAVRTPHGGPGIVVELFEVTNHDTVQKIHQLELDEGYYAANELINGNRTIIYLCESADNYPEVTGGDWVTFFRERTNWA
jgi:hypothetical protein